MRNERGFVTTVVGVMMGVTILALALALSGCAGRVYMGWEPTDQVVETRSMQIGKTVWCRIFVCDEEAKKS